MALTFLPLPTDAHFVTPRDVAMDIVQRVAVRHHVSTEALFGTSQRRNHAWPRQEAYARVREATGWSYPRIGRFFRGRDHTTILYGIRAHEARQARASA